MDMGIGEATIMIPKPSPLLKLLPEANYNTYPPGERITQKRKRRRPFKKGDQVNLRHLLFNQKRGFLIKHDSDQLVNAWQLEGKIIVLHFVLLDPDQSWRWSLTAHLADLYTELLSSSSDAPPRPFEVVFVGVSDHPEPSHEQRFQEVFSSMPPWPAVPYSDSNARERLAKRFVASDCGGYLPSSIVISKTGVVLQNNALPLLLGYGAEGYPFSDQRISCLALEDDEVRQRPSLKALLVSPKRDYLINNKGDKVNVCDLEDKVVALYLYEEGWTDDRLTRRLKVAYRQCVQEKKNFEVVLIYIHETYNTYGRTDAGSFKSTFETMPWLALPFKDANCKKVMRVFRYPSELGGPQPDPSLVIIGPRGEYFESIGGASVLLNFGMEAYPFTCKEACRLQVEKVKNLKLEMLFGQESVFIRGSGSDYKVRFSDIVGKTIIVFSETSLNVWYKEFRMKLLERYLERKGKNDEFEVIHLEAKDEDAVPWLKLVDQFCGEYFAILKKLDEYLRYSSYGILVFDRDGKVVRATSNPRLFKMEGTDFPFDAGHLEEEVVSDLKNLYNWNFWEKAYFVDD